MKINQFIHALVFVVAYLQINIEPAFANAGVPMIIITLPGMLIALVPIILIEAWYLSRGLQLPFSRSAKVSGITNVISTIAGVPLAWGIQVGLAFLIIWPTVGIIGATSPQLDQPEGLVGLVLALGGLILWPAWLGGESLYWQVPVAVLILLIPAFFMSWLVEHKIAKRMLPSFEPVIIRGMVFWANLITYGILSLGTSIWLLWSLIVGPEPL